MRELYADNNNRVLNRIEHLQDATRYANTDFKKMLAVKGALTDAARDFQTSLQEGPAEKIEHNGMRVLALIDAAAMQIFNFSDSYSYMEKKIFELDAGLEYTPVLIKGGAQ